MERFGRGGCRPAVEPVGPVDGGSFALSLLHSSISGRSLCSSGLAGGQFAGTVGTLARGWLVHSGIWRHVGLDTRVTDAQRHAHGLSVPLALAEGRHALAGDHLATASSWAISALFLSRA